MPGPAFEQIMAKINESPEDAARWRQFCRVSDPIYQWAKIYVPHMIGKPFSPVHNEIWALQRQVIYNQLPEDKKRAVVAMPRYMGKTHSTGVISSLYFSCESVCENPHGRYEPQQWADHDLLYLTGSEALAKKTMEPVIHELETNERILCDYGKLIDKTSEGIDMWLNNGLWIGWRGMGNRVRGLHPAILWGDDLEDRQNVTNEDTRARFWADWDTVDMMMKKGRSSFYIGNYIHFFCFLKRVGEMPQSEERVFSALVKNKRDEYTSIWPEMWPTQELLDDWDEKGDIFLTEKMNQPVTESQSPIQMKDIRYYDIDAINGVSAAA